MSKSAKGSPSGSYKSAGRTSDGVTILVPKSKPTHFTRGEVRTTIREVLRDGATDRLQNSSSGDRQPRKG
jgi:hypothetical protein